MLQEGASWKLLDLEDLEEAQPPPEGQGEEGLEMKAMRWERHPSPKGSPQKDQSQGKHGPAITYNVDPTLGQPQMGSDVFVDIPIIQPGGETSSTPSSEFSAEVIAAAEQVRLDARAAAASRGSPRSRNGGSVVVKV